MRRIDDNRLLDMVSQGRPQKDIATYFGVSPAAVCKRLKRLASSPDNILDKYALTDKEKAFAVEKAKGRTNTQAALASYEVGSMDAAKSIGSRLMTKHDVRQAIWELMQSEGLSHRHRIRRLRSHVDNRDPNVSLKALDMSFKLDDSYPRDKDRDEYRGEGVIVNINIGDGGTTAVVPPREVEIVPEDD